MNAQDARKLSEENSHRIAERLAQEYAEAEAERAQYEIEIGVYHARYLGEIIDRVGESAQEGNTSIIYKFGFRGYDPDWGEPDYTLEREAQRRLKTEVILLGYRVDVLDANNNTWMVSW
jgi:hypothetical protein